MKKAHTQGSQRVPIERIYSQVCVYHSPPCKVNVHGMNEIEGMESENEKTWNRRKIHLNGNLCKSQADFWDNYALQLHAESARHFGKNLDAFNDAITGGGPGYPGDCLIEIVGTNNLIKLFGQSHYDFIIGLLLKAEFVDLAIEGENQE